MTVSAKGKPARHTLPAEVSEVALLDIKDVCAAVRMSTTWVHDEVRIGRFPQPLRFGLRCTRWRANDIRAWLVERADQAASASEATELLTAKAKKASAAAQAKRQAQAIPAA